MRFTKPGWRTQLTLAYALSLGVLLLLAVGHFVVVGKKLAEFAEIGPAVNAAGRQRMLVARTAHLCEQLIHQAHDTARGRLQADILATTDELQVTHGDLRRQDAGRLSSSDPPPDSLERFVAQARSLALASEERLTHDNPDYRSVQEAAFGPLMATLDKAVRFRQEQGSTEVTRFYALISWTLAATLLVLIAIGLYVFRPAALRVGRELSRQETGMRRQRQVVERTTLEMREQARLFHSILQSTAEGIVVADAQGQLTLSNPAAQSILGRIPEGVPVERWSATLGLRLSDRRTPCVPDWFPLRRAVHGMETDPEVFYVDNGLHPGGTWVSAYARPLRNGTGTAHGGLLVIRDITLRKEAADRLEESEKRMRLLVEQLPAILWTVDEDLRFTSSFGPGLALLGFEPEQLTGTSMLSLFQTEDRSYLPIAAQIQANSGTATGYEIELRGRHYDVHVEPLRTERGTPKGSIGIALDLTESRRADLQFQAARQIQESLFPSSTPGLPGFDIAGATFVADTAAGDYFDYIPMGDGCVGIVVGDVTGHGVGPALIMAETRAYLRALALTETDVTDLLRRTNLFLLEDMEAERYVTLFFARLDPKARTLTYSSAGHQTGFVFDASGQPRTCLDSTGVPLGLFSSAEFAPQPPLELHPGDIVLLLTDGVEECRNEAGAFFGRERVFRVLRDNMDAGAGGIVAGFRRELERFRGERRVEDDVTLIAIKVKDNRNRRG